MIPTIYTQVAQMGDREHLFAGYKIFEELLGRESLTGLLAMSAGLPRLSKEDVAMLNDLAAANMLCDPRIWPVKLARLVASYGSALHGFSAGNLMHINQFIGAGPCQRGAEMLQELMKKIGGPENIDNTERIGAEVDILVSRERWPGFGVPFRVTDERLDALKIHLQQSERGRRPFWRLLLQTEAHLLQSRKTGANILGGIYATMLDMDFAPSQCAWMLIMILQGNFSGAAYEGAQQKAKELQSLPLEFVLYQGPQARVSPRARRTRDE